MEQTDGSKRMRHMRVLCQDIGERHLGSDGERRAADYIQSEFETAGWSVKRQTFEAPGWRYGAYELRTERAGHTFPAFPCFYSCGGHAHGEPIVYEMDRAEPITPERFADRIVLAHGAFETVRNTNAMAIDFDRVGARALIVVSPYQDTFSTKIVRQPGLERLIVMTVSRNTALDMARAIKRDGLSIKVEAENFTCQTCNLVATLTDAGTTDRSVLISAHYDTTPGIQGAGDDASGTSILLDLAQTMRETLRSAPFAVELVAFTGEEYGASDGCGYGASQYVRLRAPNKDSMAWMVSLDDVGTYLGRMQPVVSGGDALKNQLDPVLSARGLEALARPCRGCDVGPFNRIGIPTVFFSEAKPANGNAHFPLHSPRDNLDLIDPDKLAMDSAAIQSCLTAMLARQRDA